ncbi:hypothetical protein NBRC10512_004241 [Rhodotorula toruloides]|uniref:RHTO0S25e00804g1_1 n=2 Tax=Rhodotorula toruloides TaxID=5286 RepID=A0A061BIU2_RHOTO|nr:N-acyl-phosphatidylethanolamine-hydrolyzing phospholipase D [Rhodotorula toruloides NP11]EMS18841.1 N-acyl-phosphatidylethanolamine-hydrolyzing phospholipase D [Rhodotorula toruloides NP11]CDR49302.1 RHTO0S25e00804g1_1 [Rhodotorula toruloides]
MFHSSFTRLRSATASRIAAMAAAPLVVSVSLAPSLNPDGQTGGSDATDKAHHKPNGGFVNPWKSFKDPGRGPSTLFNAWKSWESHPVPPPEKLPRLVPPTFAPPSSLSASEKDAWYADLKATWLGHACFLVEFPAPPGQKGDEEGKKRGFRVLLDPVWSHRCSPSQLIGPARVTKPPIPLEEIPHVDAVVISHNHYDHLDIATLKHLYSAQPHGTLHFFLPLGNKSWLEKTIGVKSSEVTELDWWEERVVRLGEKETGAEGEGEGEKLRVVCTPCQHFTGRSLTDRNDTLWASWCIESSTGGKIWFGGDTGYRTVPRGVDAEGLEKYETCPAFAEIGKREGPMDMSFIPIGAYQPRWLFSSVHCSPEDSVELHQHVRSKKSIGMHWATWMLTPEEMTEPPRRLRSACEEYGIGEDEFGVTDIGETVRVKVERRGE